MKRFLKTRWVLRQLRKDCFNASRNNPDLLLLGETWMKRPVFVSFNAENGFMRRKRSEKKREEMIGELNSIIDYCKTANPKLIDFLRPGTEMGSGIVAPCEMIKTTGAGDDIADKWNTFVDFIAKYKIIGGILWTLFGVIWVYILKGYWPQLWSFVQTNIFTF